MKKTVLLLTVLIFLAGMTAGESETSLKGGFILNKGEESTYSWMIIHEAAYYIGGRVSIGYETQMSFYKVDFDYQGGTVSSNVFPINLFFNAKVRVIKNGIIRPYIGGGIGVLSNIIRSPDKFIIENYGATHLIAGVSVGKKKAALMVEFRLLNSSNENSAVKYAIVAGISY